MATTSNATPSNATPSTPTANAANSKTTSPGTSEAKEASATDNSKKPSQAQLAQEEAAKQKSKRVEKNEAQSIEVEKQKKNTEIKPLPEIISKRFVSQGNNDKATYFYKSNPDVEAFKDLGKKLSSRSDAEMIAKSMVAVAQSKNWESMNVKGTDKFKREVWMEANLNGIEVKGYKPSDLDIQQLKEALEKKPNQNENSVEKSEREQSESASPEDKKKQAFAISQMNKSPFKQNINEERQRVDKELKTASEPVNDRSNADSQLAKKRAEIDAKLANDKEKLKKVYLSAQTDKGETSEKVKAEVIKKHPELAPVYDLEKAAKAFVNHKNNDGKFTEKGKERFISNIREQGIDLAAKGQKVPEVKAASKSLVNREAPSHEATQ